MRSPELSIVLPVYNEEDNILPLYQKLTHALKGLKKTYEIIVVDDGSSDGSLEELKKLRKKDRTIRIIVFRKNFGQSAAINAGFSHAKGEVIIVMDADLQNDPDDIKNLLKKMKDRYDVVSGWRFQRDDSLSKRIPSRISNWLHRKLTGLDIHDSGCTLKAYSKGSVEGLELYGEMHRYIPALIAAKGFRIGEVKVEHHAREHGKSKYGGGRLLRGALDLLFIHFMTKYSSRPLHFFGILGILQIMLGFVIAAIKITDLYIKFDRTGQWEQFGPLLLLAFFLIVIGVLFVLFGFLAEIIIRIYFSEPKRTNYLIKEIL